MQISTTAAGEVTSTTVPLISLYMKYIFNLIISMPTKFYSGNEQPTYIYANVHIYNQILIYASSTITLPQEGMLNYGFIKKKDWV